VRGVRFAEIVGVCVMGCVRRAVRLGSSGFLSGGGGAGDVWSYIL
jgi:hypothetical protein